eukprot:3072998-Rhodomonas_salina.2
MSSADVQRAAAMSGTDMGRQKGERERERKEREQVAHTHTRTPSGYRATHSLRHVRYSLSRYAFAVRRPVPTRCHTTRYAVSGTAVPRAVPATWCYARRVVLAVQRYDATRRVVLTGSMLLQAAGVGGG